MYNLDALISDANRIARTDLYPARCRTIIADLVAAVSEMQQLPSGYMVNIRDGEIVGTDSPDVPDGTYTWIDDLPSKGGKMFCAALKEQPE